MTITEQYRECLKDIPIGTKLTRSQIIDMLHTKYGTNETSIIPSDHCYNMTNKGLRGSNRDNNFFLNVGNGEYEYVGEHFTGMAISDIIQLYKQDFERVDSEERYMDIAVDPNGYITDVSRLEAIALPGPHASYDEGRLYPITEQDYVTTVDVIFQDDITFEDR